MRKIITYLIKYPIWATVFMVSIIVFGVVSFLQLRYSFFPEISPDIITIQVAFPGASPEEVAEGVVLKVEENIDGLTGIDRVTSVSRENFGTVSVEITRGSDIDKVLSDVKNAVDRINSFPEGAEKPIIFEQKFQTRSISVVLYGDTDLYNLKYIAENFRDNLIESPDISQVVIEGLPDLEFSIEVSEADLRRYDMSFDEIAQAVKNANVNISGGKVDTEDEELQIRAWGRNYFAKEMNNIPVRGNPDGTVVYLKDIADIKEQWEDVPDKRHYNNHTALVLAIDQTTEEDIVKIADITKAEVALFNNTHNTVKALVLDDRTIPLLQRLELMVKNGMIGLLLIIISLGFFLNLRLSFWVSVSIPFSFAGMFIIATFVGITVNVMSLFGMILVVGILVDDGIVVAENIYAHFERGVPALKAAVDGTMEVIAPVFTSVLTTVLAFIPFFFFDAMMGKFVWQMALVVIASLIFSLFEAFIVLPAHIAHSKGMRPHKEDSSARKKIEKVIHYLTHRIYAPALKATMKHKWITLVTPIALVMFTIGLVGGGFVGLTFFPVIDGDTLPINISLISGAQESKTDSLLVEIEGICWNINEEIKSEREDGKDVIIGIKRSLGSNDLGESGSHAGKLTLELLEGELREMDSHLIGNRIRAAVGELPEAQSVTYGRSGHFGNAVSISLLGDDYYELAKARDMLVEALKDMSSLKDVTHSDQEGKREINISLKPRAYALGLTLQQVAGQVRQGFFGQEIQRIQRGKDEIKVWVRYKPEDRAALGFLNQMRINAPDGNKYPFSELAEYKIERGIVTINHLDRKREIKILAQQADVTEDLPPLLAQINDEILPPILAQAKSVRVSFEGQSRDQQKIQKSMKTAFPLSIIGMFIVVTLVFRSYIQSIIIFSLIPIGILGAVWGHGLHSLQLNMLSMFGIIALSGIIINDSIVFVDRINRNLRLGQMVHDAVFNAGISRLRPILLTTITTAFGLAPLIMETSRQAQFLIPMAVSVAYGLIFGTFILLIILPSLFMVSNSLRYKWSLWFSKITPTRESVEPAVRELKIGLIE